MQLVSRSRAHLTVVTSWQAHAHIFRGIPLCHVMGTPNDTPVTSIYVSLSVGVPRTEMSDLQWETRSYRGVQLLVVSR